MRWGRGATPGMSGWYPLKGTDRPVFNHNINADAPGRQAYLSFYLSDLKKHVSTSVLDEALSTLQQIEAFEQPVADARAADYLKWPTAFLPSFVDSEENIAALLRTIDVLIGASGTAPAEE